MADREKQNLIDEFAGVAGVDEERARFFLESSAWKLDVALTTFFEDNFGEASPSSPSAGVGAGAVPSRDVEHRPPGGGQGTSKAEKNAGQGKELGRSAASTKFGTINSLKKDESDSSDEEGQAFYAGGSERGSGQQIIGPSKKKDGNKLIDKLFKDAKNHGAEVAEPMETSGSSIGSQPFHGRAYRLGGPSAESEVIEGARNLEQKRQVDTVLKLWKNGFSLDNGPLREFDEPVNREFLNEIRQGEVPRELIREAKGGEVNLSMEDHRTEEYAKPKNVIQSFSGAGHRLGSPTDAVIAVSAAATSVGQTPDAGATSSLETVAVASVKLDSKAPTTSLQIRLADGSRLIAKFNHTHLVSDVRRYIITARPQYTSANFILMTTFPNKVITDESETLAAANLLNAVIVQKLK